MTKTRRINVHLTQTTLDAAAGAPGISPGVNRIADRYREIVAGTEIEKRFTVCELDLIREACMGWAAEPAATIRGGPALEVSDALRELADKYAVDAASLLARLQALSYPEEVALVDSIERYWQSVSATQEGER